jgi:hypothetical protein
MSPRIIGKPTWVCVACNSPVYSFRNVRIKNRMMYLSE